MDVLLIGTGRVGGTIAKRLIRKHYIKRFFLFSRTISESKALAYDLDNPKAVVVEHLTDVKNPDYVIIALSAQTESARKQSFHKRENTYQIRQDELIFNLGPLTDLSKSLKKICKDSKIIMITNPTDELTNYLRVIMKYDNIFGFGASLDCRRYSKLLKKKVICIGEHGKAIPLVNLKTKRSYELLHKKIDYKLLKFLRSRGMTHEVTGEEFSKFFDEFIDPKGSIVSVSYFLKEPILGVKGIALSIPFHVKQGKVLSPVQLSPSQLEKEMFMEEANELKESLAHILWIHKRLISYHQS